MRRVEVQRVDYGIYSGLEPTVGYPRRDNIVYILLRFQSGGSRNACGGRGRHWLDVPVMHLIFGVIAKSNLRSIDIRT